MIEHHDWNEDLSYNRRSSGIMWIYTKSMRSSNRRLQYVDSYGVKNGNSQSVELNGAITGPTMHLLHPQPIPPFVTTNFLLHHTFSQLSSVAKSGLPDNVYPEK
ncbi:unnamed protein product [Lepeophtheirus salmonis]|uniref:(salmon louse) hypothetical protein n=1 Tax=Lepeophtheirus salmonis TaxID=72036 RepID=A0A7R8CCG1_LEPSM|nr:unnamed protein product [Lepeophtheirus salmonis]CAF2770970.1 unnamed protein product [Lepeophtheirus salmonis]